MCVKKHLGNSLLLSLGRGPVTTLPTDVSPILGTLRSRRGVPVLGLEEVCGLLGTKIEFPRGIRHLLRRRWSETLQHDSLTLILC